jgi:large subunit ribosomal protein L17
MRHQRRIKRFNRTRSHRTALGRHIVGSLFRHGRIVTTVEKAKEFRRLAERLVTIAKRGPKSLHAYRRAISILQDKEMAKKLFDVIAPQFADRAGGYTRIIRMPRNRLGDNASQAIFELTIPREAADAAPKPEAAAADKKKGAPKAPGRKPKKNEGKAAAEE